MASCLWTAALALACTVAEGGLLVFFGGLAEAAAVDVVPLIGDAIAVTTAGDETWATSRLPESFVGLSEAVLIAGSGFFTEGVGTLGSTGFEVASLGKGVTLEVVLGTDFKV